MKIDNKRCNNISFFTLKRIVSDFSYSPSSFHLSCESKQRLRCLFKMFTKNISLSNCHFLNKSANVPEKKRASTVPSRIIFAVFGTLGGKTGMWDGTWCVLGWSSSTAVRPAESHPACRYIHRTDTDRPTAFCSLLATVKSCKFQIPRQKKGEASEECVGANCAPERQPLSV